MSDENKVEATGSAGSEATGAGTAGSGTMGAGTAGSGTMGSGTAGSGTPGSGTMVSGPGAAVAVAPPLGSSSGGSPSTSASSVPIDWSSLIPASAGEILSDLLELGVFWAILANAIAVWRGTEATGAVIAAGAGGAVGVVLLWKVYKAVVSALGVRAIGATYAVLGVAACALIVFFGASSGSVHESGRLRTLIYVAGLACLYPAALGGLAAARGEEPEGLNPFGLPLRPEWFSTLRVLYAKEVKTFFTTSVPYLVFFVFMVLNGALFFALIRFLTQPGADASMPPTRILFDNIVLWISFWIIPPAITMRLVSEERRMGTIETLLTAPVTDVQVIFSKFAAALSFFVAMLIPTVAYLVMLAQHAQSFDWGPVFAGYLGMILVGASFLSIGLFWSTLTQSQLVAFILGFGTNFAIFLMGLVSNFVKLEGVRDVLKYLSFQDHYQELHRGIISSRSLIFFVSIIAFFLFASIRGLETQKWK